MFVNLWYKCIKHGFCLSVKIYSIGLGKTPLFITHQHDTYSHVNIVFNDALC